MRLRLAFSFYCVLLLNTLAVCQMPPEQSDEKAKIILDRVSQTTKSHKTLQIYFSLNVENADGNAAGSRKGILYFANNGAYRIEMDNTQIFSNGKTVWTYDKKNNEVQITELDPNTNTLTPEKLFTNFYDKEFLYRISGEKKIKGANATEIEMTPFNKNKPFFKIYLYVSKNTVLQMKLFEKAGLRYIYTAEKTKINPTFKAGFFEFDKKQYPSVEEVDLR